jgi:hypothetical protein
MKWDFISHGILHSQCRENLKYYTLSSGYKIIINKHLTPKISVDDLVTTKIRSQNEDEYIHPTNVRILWLMNGFELEEP